MARYYPVSPLFWSDSEVVKWDDQDRLLALYLLTCEHRNLEGLYRLPYAYIQADLEWTPAEVKKHMATLTKSGFVKYDDEARVIFIRNVLKYHQPASTKQIQGAVNALQQVPPTVLWDDFTEAAREFAPDFFNAIGNPSERDTREGVTF